MLTNFLDKTMVIQSRSTAADSAGGLSPTWTSRLTDIPCSCWPASYQTRTDYAKRDLIAQYEFAVGSDVDCSANDRITVDGRTHTVIGYGRYEQASMPISPLYIVVTGLRNQ